MTSPTIYTGLPPTNGDSTCIPHSASPTESRFSFIGHSLWSTEQEEAALHSFTSQEEKALRRLISSWMERLQLISVLTIFFASVEATLLSITIPNTSGGSSSATVSKVTSAANTGLLGGLVLHILAAFISFLAGFFLVRYKIKWARKERKMMAHRRDMEGSLRAFKISKPHPAGDVHGSTEMEQMQPPKDNTLPGILNDPAASIRSFEESPGAEGGRFIHRGALPTKLLGRFHFLCVVLTLLGFIFALVGIICLTWDRLPHDAGIVCVVITLFCLIAVVAIILLPDSDEECPKRELTT